MRRRHGGRTPEERLKNAFEKYRVDERVEVRKIQVNRKDIFRRMAEKFQKYLQDSERGMVFGSDLYEIAEKEVKDLNCSKEEVAKFLEMALMFRHESRFSDRVAMFLSALTNNGSEREYILDLREVGPGAYVAYRNSKALTIEGDVKGAFACSNRGDITLNGNIVGDFPFMNFKGGVITVNGNILAEWRIEMTGGELHLNGDFLTPSLIITGGRIFHHGVEMDPRPEFRPKQG